MLQCKARKTRAEHAAGFAASTTRETRMRIIAGTAKGRPLLAPKGMDTRPTLARVKEALFGILQFQIPGARVLDLYAGSGSLGLEALSRGAQYVVFSDVSRDCCQIIKKNLQAFGFSQRADVLNMDAASALARLDAPFDIALLDPPYTCGAQALLDLLFENGHMRSGGVAVVEHAWAHPPQERPGLYTRVKCKKYSDTGLSFFEAATP